MAHHCGILMNQFCEYAYSWKCQSRNSCAVPVPSSLDWSGQQLPLLALRAGGPGRGSKRPDRPARSRPGEVFLRWCREKSKKVLTTFSKKEIRPRGSCAEEPLPQPTLALRCNSSRTSAFESSRPSRVRPRGSQGLEKPGCILRARGCGSRHQKTNPSGEHTHDRDVQGLL